jgi:hypothetical protein
MPLLRPLRPGYDEALAAEFAAQPLGAPRVLEEPALAPLPAPVQRFLRGAGCVGRPIPQNVRIEFDAQMWRAPGQAPMPARSVQYNFFDRPARLFFMTARMYGLPVAARHLYRAEAASFVVRVASAVTVTDHSGPEFTATETVTLLNDLCAYAPARLVDDRIAWQPVDDRSATATMTNGPHRVSATLVFNDRDELVDFWSDDRPAEARGSFRRLRWSTPLEGHRDIDGHVVPTVGRAVYAYAEGDFTYGAFTLRSLAYDLAGPLDPGPPLP